MQLNRPKSAHLISSSPHNSSSYSSQFNSMRFSYHISSGLSSPQPALRRSGESGADSRLDAISGSFQFQRFACSAAKASLHITEVTLMYADVSVTNKPDRKEHFCLKKNIYFNVPTSWKSIIWNVNVGKCMLIFYIQY